MDLEQMTHFQVCVIARKQEQALIDRDLALMEQTELAVRCRKQAEKLEVENLEWRAELRRRPKQRSVYDWLHLVETKIGTPTAASAARVLKEFYEGAEPDDVPAILVQAGMPAVTVDCDAFWDRVIAYGRGVGHEGKFLVEWCDARIEQAVAQTAAKYEADILALYDRQREDGNTIAALRAAAPQQHAQAAQYADNGKQHEDPTGPNHPGQHDGHTCEAMGQMLADFGSQRTTPESVVARMDTQAALSDQVWADSPEFVTAKDALVDAGVKSAQSGASIDVQAYLAAEDHFIETVSALATPAIQQEGAALSDEQIGEAVQRGYSKDDGIRMCYSDQQNVIKEVRTILAASQQPAAAPSADKLAQQMGIYGAQTAAPAIQQEGAAWAEWSSNWEGEYADPEDMFCFGYRAALTAPNSSSNISNNWREAIDGLADFAPTNRGPLPGMTRGGAYVLKANVIDALSAIAPLQPQPAALADAAPVEAKPVAWATIDTAPKDGRTILLGYFNKLGNWRTMRGQWYSAAAIADEWEDPDEANEGWYETAVEPDAPNCWATAPTHWQPLPEKPATSAALNKQEPTS